LTLTIGGCGGPTQVVVIQCGAPTTCSLLGMFKVAKQQQT
ncbi:hypothetical protein A2U01_0067259, partial [Trifolium medium]|nr:hypothetical protein [Trifolium medium]